MADGNILPEPGATEPRRILINDISDWPNVHVGALRKAGGGRPIEALSAELGHDDPIISAAAAASLTEIGDSRAIDALVMTIGRFNSQRPTNSPPFYGPSWRWGPKRTLDLVILPPKH
jgi:hypothetical protein